MIVEVVGVKRNMSFKIDGTEHRGTNIYVTHLENGVEGRMAEKYFLNAKSFDSSNIKVGDTLDIQFNRFGKVASFGAIEIKANK